MTSDFKIHLGDSAGPKILNKHQPLEWNIIFAETGGETLTGKRISLCKKYLDSDTFMVTYGDGLGDINIPQLHQFHLNNGAMATVTGVRPSGRFGALKVEGTTVTGFSEKKDAGGGLINGGFFVFNKEFLGLLDQCGDTMLETTPMDKLVKQNQLQVFNHIGFWEPMDTMREYLLLNKIWDNDEAPWKVWK